MIKKSFELLKEKNFQNLFDLSVGKVYATKSAMMNFIGEHAGFNTDLSTCKLTLNEKEYTVDYIGTASATENMWFSAELEKEIPDDGVRAIIQVRKLFGIVGLEEFYKGKIALNEELTADMLATIYTAFMPEQQAYYVGKTNDVSLFMRIKDLPEGVFAPLNDVEFIPMVTEIINNTPVKNHKLMVMSFALNNGCTVKTKGNKVVVVFDNNECSFEFNEENRLIVTDGDADGKELKVEGTAPIVLSEEATEGVAEGIEEAQDEIEPIVLPEIEDVKKTEAEGVAVETEVATPTETVVTEELPEDFVPTMLPAEENVEEPTQEVPSVETQNIAEAENIVEDTPADIEEEPIDKEFSVDPINEEVVEENTMPEIEDVERPVVLPAEATTEELPEDFVPTVLPAEESVEEVFETVEEVENIPEVAEVVENDEEDQDENKILELADAVLNCCEQSGLFEEYAIEDEEKINKICTATAIRLMDAEPTEENLVASITAACDRNGVILSQAIAKTFANAYLESYVAE